MHSDTAIPIPNPKVNLLINQFRRENESWKLALAFLIEEDIILKAGISEILKNMTQTDEDILKRLEHFHNRLIKENDTVRLLRTAVNDTGIKLNRDFYFEAYFLNSIINLQSKLRKEIEKAELDFLELKFDFNDYIPGIFQNEF
ncbi:MAG TPA: hypothetical protein VMU83_11635 [Hanamia sp.]|nr:hypothetical protein [Hanamia sp.]